MNELLSLLGPYTYEGTSLIFTYLECQVSIFLFSLGLEKRDCFPFRLLMCCLSAVCFCYVQAIVNTTFASLGMRVASYLFIAMLNLLTALFCYGGSISDILLSFCSAIAAYQVTGKLYPLAQNLLGINDRETISFHAPEIPPADWEWALFFLYHIAMYWLLSMLFRPRGRLSGDRKTAHRVAGLSVGVVLTVNVLICISRVYEAESFALNIVVKIFCVGFGVVVLLACAGIFSQDEKEHQISVLQQLWKQDRAQFESVKASMDVINMKCHDLKHILNKIEGKLAEDEITSLREAIQFYDANIKTGNEVLDVVLCEKAMMCQKNGIRFSCMADGTDLSFLTPVQTYTLFGNIIDNAVEAVQKLPEPENKVIALSCRQSGEVLEIEESNYFNGRLQLVDGLPSTVKADPSRHGFGIRSIRYIAEQYGGQLEIKTGDDMFFLNVRFPLKKLRASA